MDLWNMYLIECVIGFRKKNHFKLLLMLVDEHWQQMLVTFMINHRRPIVINWQYSWRSNDLIVDDWSSWSSGTNRREQTQSTNCLNRWQFFTILHHRPTIMDNLHYRSTTFFYCPFLSLLLIMTNYFCTIGYRRFSFIIGGWLSWSSLMLDRRECLWLIVLTVNDKP